MAGILFGKKNMKLTNIEKKIYYNLKFVRKVQLEMIERYHQGDKMKCPMHFCTGQEIMPAAISPYLNKTTQYIVIIDLMAIFYVRMVL